MRIEEAKEKIINAITPVIEEFYKSTGIEITAINIHSINIRCIDDIFNVKQITKISLQLNY